MPSFPLVELFPFLSVSWYVGLAFTLFLLAWAIEQENGKIAGIIFFIWLACDLVFGNSGLFKLVALHPYLSIGIFCAYWVIGAGWCVRAWDIFCDERYEEYDLAKREFARSNGVQLAPGEPLPLELRKSWEEFCQRSFKWSRQVYNRETGREVRVVEIKPHWYDYKLQHSRELFWWPISLGVYLTWDFFHRISKTVVKIISGWLEAIANRRFENVSNDFSNSDKD